MTGYSKFSGRPFEINEDPLIWDTQFSYMRGYILALEDVLGDLVGMTLDLTPPCDLLVARTHDQIRAKVQLSLDRANKTLETLESLRSERDGT